jgi:hypothetical protein
MRCFRAAAWASLALAGLLVLAWLVLPPAVLTAMLRPALLVGLFAGMLGLLFLSRHPAKAPAALILLLAALAAALVLPRLAFAADGTSASAAQTLGAAIEPYVVDLLGVVVAVVIGWLAKLAGKYLGAGAQAAILAAEASHRDALHSALQTGADAIVAKLGAAAADPKNQAAAAILDHVEIGAADALDALAPSPEALANLAAAKLNAALVKATGVTLATPPPAAAVPAAGASPAAKVAG